MTRTRLWHGSVRADALLFTRELPHRAVGQWAAGAKLHRFDDGLLLSLPASRRMRAQEAPGEVLIRVAGRLTNAAIGAEDASAFPPSSVIRLTHGELIAVSMPATPVAANEILDVSDFALRLTYPLTATATPKVVVKREETAPTHEILSVERSPEAAKIADAIARGERASRPQLRGIVPRSPSRSWLDLFRGVFNRLILTTRLAAYLGRKQAQYLANLVDMLERRQFDEALRHAIPLSDEIASRLSEFTFAMPRPRGDLSLNLHAPPSSSTTMAGGGDFHETLRRLYREAAAQLERNGAIERAAFVLADLLNAPEQAVSLLERHNLLRLAARLAEARNLHPSLVVRQWLLAGDRERAVAIARRHEVFEVVITKIAASHPALANTLRVEWATLLASRGAFAAACDVLWPVSAQRERVRAWLEEAIRRGGTGGARALARKLEIAPDEKYATLAAIAALLDDEDPDAMPARRFLAAELSALPPSPDVRSAMRLSVRAMVRDATLSSREIGELAKKSGDGTLRADLPSLPASPMTSWFYAATTISHNVAAHDTGATAILDAAMLEGGLLAIAHGESGVSLVRRDGTIAARLHEPAYRLIVSDLGDRALALAPRGDGYRIAKLDFATRTARYWLDARVASFAESYDGATWMIEIDGDVHAIDTNAARFESQWYAPGVGRIISPITRTRNALAFLTEGGQAWRYELPSLMLRARTPVNVERATLCVALVDDTTVLVTEKDEQTVLHLKRPITFNGKPLDLIASEHWIALTLQHPGESETLILDPTGRTRVRLHFGNGVPGLRITSGHFTFFDDRGRLAAIDIERGKIVRDLRV